MKKVLPFILAGLIMVFATGSHPDYLNSYLGDNCQVLDLGNADLSLLGADLGAQVFLSGAQWHGTTTNYDLHFALLTALNRQAGVRSLLLDSGYGTAQVYNDYIQTGDLELLRLALDGIRFSNSSNNEHRLFWENLYQYNQQLPPAERITVVGIDIEYQVGTALGYLNYLSDQRFTELCPITEYLGDTPALDKYVSGVQAQLRNQPASFAEIFGEDLPRFRLILQNLADTVTTDRHPDFYVQREKLLYANCLAALARDPQAKFFGHFTMEHIFQRQVQTGNLAQGDRLAMLLSQEDSPFQGVVSFAALYRDSELRFYYGRYETYRVFNFYITDPLPQPTADCTLYKLNGPNSPYTWAPYTVISPTGGAATDYYQYLLIVQNSKPTTPNLLAPSN